MPPTPKKKPTYEEISERFHLPLQRAADDMGKYVKTLNNLNARLNTVSIGICQTLLKKFCRQYGINRWPYRRIKSIIQKGTNDSNVEMNEDEYKVKVVEFIRENKEFVFNNFNDSSDFGTPQQPPSNIPNNSNNFNSPNNIGNNYANMYQTSNNVIPNNNNLFNSQSSQLMMGSSNIPNSINNQSHNNTWTNNMNHHSHNNYTQNHSVGTHQQPVTGNNNSYSNVIDSSMIINSNHAMHQNNTSNNTTSFSWGMQPSMNQQPPTHNTMNINPNTSLNMGSLSSHNTQIQPQQSQQVLNESADVCMGDAVFTSSSQQPQQNQQAIQSQHSNFQSSPQPAISSLRRPQLLKANSHSSITFSNCANNDNNHFQTGTLSTCSSSSSLSDLVSTMSGIDLDNDSNNSSGMLRRTTSSFSRPPLKKSSSLTAVAQQTAKGIQKKKEQVLSVSTVQSLVSSSLSSSPQQQEMHMPVPPQQSTTPYSPMSRPMFVKSKSHGQISIQLPNQNNKLPSLSQVFGEKFFEETRPNTQFQ